MDSPSCGRPWSGLIAESYFASATAGDRARPAAWLALGAFAVAAPALALRPQLIAMALFSLTLLLVVERHEHPRRLWLVPVHRVLWANVHGSFFLAPAVLGLAWLSDMEQRAANRHLALRRWRGHASACCLTPFGPQCLDCTRSARRKPGSDAPDQRVAATTSERHLRGSSSLGRRCSSPRSSHAADRADAVGRRCCGSRSSSSSARTRSAGIAWWPLAAVAALAPLLRRGPRRGRSAEREQPRAMPHRQCRRGGRDRHRRRRPAAVWRPDRSGHWRPGWRAVVRAARDHRSASGGGPPAPTNGSSTRSRGASWFEFAVPQTSRRDRLADRAVSARVWADYVRVTAGVDGWEDILAAGV